MKKVLFALMLLFGTSFLAVSCTTDEIDEIEIQSPDKDKDEPIGGGHDGVDS
jgi:hypothetical protein